MKYVAPEMELVMFTNEDVIVASGTDTPEVTTYQPGMDSEGDL